MVPDNDNDDDPLDWFTIMIILPSELPSFMWLRKSLAKNLPFNRIEKKNFISFKNLSFDWRIIMLLLSCAIFDDNCGLFFVKLSNDNKIIIKRCAIIVQWWWWSQTNVDPILMMFNQFCCCCCWEKFLLKMEFDLVSCD